MLRPYTRPVGDIMPYDRFRHHRRTLRLRDRDYTRAAAYFVTIRAVGDGDLLGTVADGAVTLNDLGRVVETCWRAIPDHHLGVRLDAWVVMPDHMHGILILPHGVPMRHATGDRAQDWAQHAAPDLYTRPDNEIPPSPAPSSPAQLPSPHPKTHAGSRIRSASLTAMEEKDFSLSNRIYVRGVMRFRKWMEEGLLVSEEPHISSMKRCARSSSCGRARSIPRSEICAAGIKALGAQVRGGGKDLNRNNQAPPVQSVSIIEAGLQQIQLELIRRTSFNQFAGEKVNGDLLRHRHLWRGVLMESSVPLVKLRDMVDNDYQLWNVDTLYILAVDQPSAMELRELAKTWTADYVEICASSEANELMGSMGEDWWLVRVWWD